MIQHNPHPHSLLCPGLQVTLDAFEAREIDERPDCPGCQCSLASEAEQSPPDPGADAEAETVDAPADA